MKLSGAEDTLRTMTEQFEKEIVEMRKPISEDDVINMSNSAKAILLSEGLVPEKETENIARDYMLDKISQAEALKRIGRVVQKYIKKY